MNCVTPSDQKVTGNDAPAPPLFAITVPAAPPPAPVTVAKTQQPPGGAIHTAPLGLPSEIVRAEPVGRTPTADGEADAVGEPLGVAAGVAPPAEPEADAVGAALGVAPAVPLGDTLPDAVRVGGPDVDAPDDSDAVGDAVRDGDRDGVADRDGVKLGVPDRDAERVGETVRDGDGDALHDATGAVRFATGHAARHAHAVGAAAPGGQ